VLWKGLVQRDLLCGYKENWSGLLSRSICYSDHLCCPKDGHNRFFFSEIQWS